MKYGKSCENCIHYRYDEYYDSYGCDADLDEDEMGRFLTRTMEGCPYFRLDDEYGLVRKQN